MKTRIISGIIAASVLIAILLLPPVFLACTILIVSIIGIFEFYKATDHLGHRADRFVGVAASIWICGSAWVSESNAQSGYNTISDFNSGIPQFFQFIFSGKALMVVSFLLLLILFLQMVFRFGKFKAADVAFTVLGIAYVPFLLSFGLRLRLMLQGDWLVWAVVAGTLMTDIFAYFVGVSIGKHKMLPLVSPKKSWEGAIGGVLGSIISMAVFGMALPIFIKDLTTVLSFEHYLGIGLVCGIISQIGDWTASAFKRETGIKDYGNFIPGHGGMLDRLDSFLMTVPAVYLYMTVLLGV